MLRRTSTARRPPCSASGRKRSPCRATARAWGARRWRVPPSVGPGRLARSRRGIPCSAASLTCRSAWTSPTTDGDSGLSAEALSVVGLVQANPELTQALTELMTKQAELRALRHKDSDADPPVQRLLGEIATLQRQTIPTLARQLAGQLAAKETELGRRVDAASRTLKQLPARAIEEARLRRDAAPAEHLYLSLQGKYDEARLAEASTLSDVRVLDSAVVPRRPVKNTRRRVILLAFFGSFAMAVVGAVLIDRVDPRVRYPDQVSREMGLTI